MSLSQKQTIVDDLQRRLNEAIADRDNTKRQLDQAVADRTSLPSQISKAANDISQYQASYETCTRETSSIIFKIQTLSDQLRDLNNQINDVNSKIQSIQQQIDSITIRITTIDSSTPDAEGKLADLRNSLQFLKEEYSKTSLERNRLYAAGNDANNGVVMAKQNLEAVIARYKQEQTNIDNANLNLERARAQEAIARQAQEELIAYYSNALPYAIVPNGNGNTNPGTPAGNNPSGSPLGPVSQGGNGAPGSYTITNWVSYLSQAYGAGVSPAYSGSVTALYPFSFSSVVRGNNVYNNMRDASSSGGNSGSSGWCGGSGSSGTVNLPSVSTTGTVVAVRDSSFDMRVGDGSIVTVNVAPCTSLNSNRQDYQIKSGDVAVVKAWQESSSTLNSQSVTCLSTQ